MEIDQLRAKREEGKPLSQSAEQALRKYKAELRKLLGAGVVYPEDRIEITDPQAFLMYLGNIRQLEEFQANPQKASQLLKQIQNIFGFSVLPSSIYKYYYTKKKANKY